MPSKNSISKPEIIRLCAQNGISISKDFTMSSKNANGRTYWANPNVDKLSRDWYLVLVNTEKRELYVFKIPQGEITKSQIILRTDNENRIDLQFHSDLVWYPDFEDSKSKLKFKKWLIKTIPY